MQCSHDPKCVEIGKHIKMVYFFFPLVAEPFFLVSTFWLAMAASWLAKSSSRLRSASKNMSRKASRGSSTSRRAASSRACLLFVEFFCYNWDHDSEKRERERRD